jgi:hypothetical protein
MESANRNRNQLSNVMKISKHSMPITDGTISLFSCNTQVKNEYIGSQSFFDSRLRKYVTRRIFLNVLSQMMGAM